MDATAGEVEAGLDVVGSGLATGREEAEAVLGVALVDAAMGMDG